MPRGDASRSRCPDDVGGVQPLRRGRRAVADADHLRVAGLLGARSARARRASSATASGSSPSTDSSTGARSGSRHQLRRRDGRPPVVGVDERRRLRGACREKRTDIRPGPRRRRRGGVGAAHARRVLGGEAGEAEGLRGIAFLGRLAQHGRGLGLVADGVDAESLEPHPARATRGEQESCPSHRTLTVSIHPRLKVGTCNLPKQIRVCITAGRAASVPAVLHKTPNPCLGGRERGTHVVGANRAFGASRRLFQRQPVS